MRVCVYNMFRCCTRYRLLPAYVGLSFSNPPSLVSTVPYVAVMGVRPHMQSIPGVVLLHLLLVPGTAFLVGGARVWEQKLHPHRSQLNLSLLTVGSVTLFSPSCQAMLNLKQRPCADRSRCIFRCN